jgi:hypothetical protein
MQLPEVRRDTLRQLAADVVQKLVAEALLGYGFAESRPPSGVGFAQYSLSGLYLGPSSFS